MRDIDWREVENINNNAQIVFFPGGEREFGGVPRGEVEEGGNK